MKNIQRIFIPSLTGGVSRQPQTQRLLNQVEQADNCTMALARGLQKRPGTKHIAKLSALSGVDLQDHGVIWCRDYSGVEFFLLINKSLTNPVLAYKTDGTALTVSYTTADVKTYLKSGSTDSQDSYTWCFFNNKLMIANRDVTTALTGSASDYQYGGGAHPAVRDSANGHYKSDATAFALPPAASGQYWYAAASSSGFPKGFYISQNHTGVGPWYIRVKTQEANSDIDATTMPVVATLSGTTLTLSKVSWTPRYSGSSLSNPGPSFIGKKIRSLNFHRGRLCVGAQDRLVLSDVGDNYNFWVKDYSNISDDDFVDISMPAGAGKIIHTVTFSKALVIFTDNARQLELRADGSLTPSSANLIPTTGYSCNDTCTPSIIGNHLYFATQRGNSGQMYDYYWSFDQANNIAPDISAHTQGYLPTGIEKMSVSPNNDVLAAKSRDQLDTLYIYQSYFTDSQRVQAAWMKWIFADAQIQSHECFDGTLYLLLKRGIQFYLESIPMHKAVVQDATLGYPILYDRYVSLSGTYNSTTNHTTWTVPYSDSRVVQVILGDGFDSRVGRIVTVTPTAGATTTTITVVGRYDQGTIWTGVPYTMNVELSTQFIRDQNGGVVMGTLQLLRLKVDHRDTGSYDVTVTPSNRETKTWRFTPLTVGNTQVGVQVIQDFGSFYCKPYCSAKDSIIRIRNSTPLPCNISNLEFAARFVQGKAAVV